jgi:hypothetical protein
MGSMAEHMTAYTGKKLKRQQGMTHISLCSYWRWNSTEPTSKYCNKERMICVS